MVQRVNSSNFDKEVIKAPGLVVADFWAEWCGPCKIYGPRFEEIATSNATKGKFVKVNVEEAEDVASELGIQSIPTTVFFKDGKEVDRVTGLLSKEQLAQKVQQLA